MVPRLYIQWIILGRGLVFGKGFIEGLDKEQEEDGGHVITLFDANGIVNEALTFGVKYKFQCEGTESHQQMQVEHHSILRLETIVHGPLYQRL